MKRHQIVWLVAFALLVLAPVQAEATSHSSLTQLCTWIDCQAALAVLPKITQADSPITPGGYVVIQGSRFGQLTGELWLTGLKSYSGPSLPPIKLTIPLGSATWDFWQSKFVVGFVPDNIYYVTDQPAKLQIKTKDNKWSNEFPVTFKATRDIKVLPYINLSPGDCSDEADFDRCNNVKHENFILFCSSPIDFAEGGTFYGFHWTCVGDSNGTDSFRFSLREKYGWSLYSADLDYSTGGIDPPVTTSGPQDWGVTYTKVSLHWNNETVSYVSYRVNVSIVGPKGVPHY